MAHALRYYKNIVQSNGRRIRIEFHEKDGTAAAMELGNVIQSLNLEIQGGGDVDEPIVKTQLNFTLVDAPDHADHKTKKCGAWEEFYSPDATHWKVLLFYKEIGESSYTQFWGGYITPDSYHEILTYRAGISFIARDNIGHLQDFPFDAEGNADGMITLYDLLMSAWAKIESPMELVTKTDGDAEWLRCEGNNALYTYMNVSAFEGKNWLEAVTEALYGYGLVMRYVGENYVYVYPLRNLAVFPFGGSGVDVQFETGAERELSPAVRRIEESVEYTIEETIARKLVQSNEYSGAVVNATIEGKNVSGETITKTAKANPLSNTSGKGWYNPSRDGAMLLNPKAYDVAQVKDFIASDMVFLLNTKNTEVVYSAAINPQNINIRLAFGTAVEILGSQLTPKWFVELSQLKYAISATQNGITQYWSGDEWTATKKELSATFDNGEVGIYCNARSFTGEVKINLHIYSVRYDSKVSSEDAAYAALNSFTFASAESPALLTTNRVNTNYIDTNNVILSRNPQIAPALNTTFMPAVIKNGIFVQQGTRYNPASLWSWKADGTGGQQMAVYNHLQLLCYHGKPNNILSGTILNADVTNIGKVYRWNNTEHILLSGTLNLISGYVEGATLREFARYENMWGDLTDTADLPEVEGGSTNNVDGGARSGGNTATYSNTTEVNIGGGGTMVLDTYMSDSSTNGVQNKVIKSYVDTAVDSLETSIGTKAKQSDLTALQTRVSANESAIADRYTKTEVDAKVKTLADADTALGNRITPLEEWKTDKDKFFAKFYLGVDGNVYCDTNLIIAGDTSSGGSGEPSTNQGIDIEELQKYLDDNAYIDETELNSALSNYAESSYVIGQINGLATSIGNTYATKSSLAAVATSGKYTDLSGRPNLGDLAYLDSITKSMITEALDYTPFDAANFTKDNIITKIGTTTYAPYNANGYLPLNGGTIKGDLYLKKDDWYQGAYTTIFRNASASADYGTQIINSWDGGETRLILSKEDISFRKDGINNTLIHSGNIGRQNAGTATRAKYIETIGSDWYGDKYTLRGAWHEATVCDWEINGYEVRIDRAKKLDTARTIWGQSFDGTENVSGSLTGTNFLIMDRASNPYLKFTENGLNGFIQFLEGIIAIGPTSTKSLLVNYNGNVTIGDRDLATTSWKFYVDGKIGGVSILHFAKNTSYGIYKGNAYSSSLADTDIAIYATKTILGGGGNVGIGTISPEQKLDVAGVIKNNSYVMSSAGLFVGSDYSNRLTNGLYAGNLMSGSLTASDLYLYSTSKLLLYGGGGVTIAGATTLSSTLSVATSITTPLLKSSGGLDIVANNSGAGSRLWLTTNVFRPWGADAGLIDLGASDIRWKGLYCGTGNFSGAVTMSSTLSVSGNVTLSKELFFGNNQGLYFKNSSGSNVLAMYVNPNNILQIGYNNIDSVAFQKAVTMASTLSVGGTSLFDGNITANGNLYMSNISRITFGDVSQLIASTNGLMVYSPLEVSGQTTINNNLIVTGDTASGSDIRFKDIIENKTIKIEDIANAPLFSFKWNDREDDTLHLGTSAQYWENVAPELVSGSDFKTLNYASLGVAMGIALAKKNINHEERIKMLEDEVKVLNAEIKRLRNGKVC